MGNFFQGDHVAVGVGCMWGQEVSLQLVLQQHVVLRRQPETRSEKDKEWDCCYPMIQEFNILKPKAINRFILSCKSRISWTYRDFLSKLAEKVSQKGPLTLQIICWRGFWRSSCPEHEQALLRLRNRGLIHTSICFLCKPSGGKRHSRSGSLMGPEGPCRGKRAVPRRCGKTGSPAPPGAGLSRAGRALSGSPGPGWSGWLVESPVENTERWGEYSGVTEGGGM